MNTEDYERMILGTILWQPHMIVDVASTLRVDDFSGQRAKVMQAMCEVYSRDIPLDCLNVARQMDTSRETGAKGAHFRLMTLMNDTPDTVDSSQMEWYCRQIAEQTVRRKLRRAAHEMLAELDEDLAAPAPRDIDEVAERCEGRLTDALGRIRGHESDRGPRSIGDLVETARRVRSEGGEDYGLISTGFASLDDLIGGLPVGTLTVVGARPSIGKTAFCQSMAVLLAMAGTPVFYVMLEDVSRTMLGRLVAQQSGMQSREFGRLVSGQWAGEGADMSWDGLQPHLDQIGQLPIWVDDTPGMTAEIIRMRIRDMVRKQGVKVAIIDHALEIRGSGDDYARVTHAVQVCRDTASELGIAVVLASQIHRAADDGGKNAPKLRNLKSSGKFDEAARLALILHRPEYYVPDPSKLPHPLIVGCDKVSEGSTGRVGLFFDPRRTLVREPTASESTYIMEVMK